MFDESVFYYNLKLTSHTFVQKYCDQNEGVNFFSFAYDIYMCFFMRPSFD